MGKKMENIVKINQKGIFIINSLAGGGAERVFCKLIRMINDSKSTSYVIHIVLLDKEKEAYSIPDNIIIHRFGGNKLCGIFKLYRLINKINPDFVFSFLMRSNILNIITGVFKQHKVLINERANTNQRIRGRFSGLKKYLLKKSYQKADKVICCSQGVKDCLETDYDIKSENLVVINNSYNIEFLEEKSRIKGSFKEQYIVAIGRLVEAKGFNDLITAFSLLDSDIRLKILGEGPLLNSLKKHAVNSGVSDRVDFQGFVPNPYPIIKASELYILSSYVEGFPNSLAEAMALSRPVIATNCFDGPSEILDYSGMIETGEVINARFGLLINTGDIKAMAQAMSVLIENQDLRKHYKKQSVIRAHHYSEDVFYKKFSQLINNSLSI